MEELFAGELHVGRKVPSFPLRDPDISVFGGTFFRAVRFVKKRSFESLVRVT